MLSRPAIHVAWGGAYECSRVFRENPPSASYLHHPFCRFGTVLETLLVLFESGEDFDELAPFITTAMKIWLDACNQSTRGLKACFREAVRIDPSPNLASGPFRRPPSSLPCPWRVLVHELYGLAPAWQWSPDGAFPFFCGVCLP